MNLYDLQSLRTEFDEIICTEVLEHITMIGVSVRASAIHSNPAACCTSVAPTPTIRIIRLMRWTNMKPVVTCAPVIRSSRIARSRADRIPHRPGDRSGRPRASVVQQADHRSARVAGLPLGLLVFFLLWPFSWLDAAQPKVPYSLYVRAVKTK